MNKKKLAIFGLPILAIALVSAVAYYGFFSVDLTIHQPIDISGNLEQSVGCDSGEICYGTNITVSNEDIGIEGKSRLINISNNNRNSWVEISYVSDTYLRKKIVNFSQDKWDIDGEELPFTMGYTLIGDDFSANIVGEGLEGYVLIYYKDNSERFDSPAKAILLENLSGNLPYETDANADEYDYCSTGEYDTCHGAKIWYVPENAISPDGSLDWSRADEFYFETELIQFNSDGEIVVYPQSSITFKPMFEINQYAQDWSGTITTTVA